MQNTQYSPGQLDAMAREKGFPDYATFVAWNRHRDANLRSGETQPAAAPTNWLQTLLERIPGHPAQTLKYAGEKFKKATGQSR